MKIKIDDVLDVILRKVEILEDDLKRKFKLEDLSVKQIQCLELIDELENPTLTELSRKLKITKPSTSAMLDKLETRGLLIKVKSDIDKRSAHVHLTQKGIETSRLHRKVHHQISALLLKPLNQEEKRALHTLLNQAIQSLSEPKENEQ